jgi:hypothetical protein
MRVDPDASVGFLTTAYEPHDWVAVLLKSARGGRVAQRVGPITRITSPRFQAWLRAENASGANVYASVNAVAPNQRSRRREAIRSIRHVFIDVDAETTSVLTAIASRRDLPPPSYVLRSSPGRAHVLWKVTAFTPDLVEVRQKDLARQLGTDPAATACTQMTRLPGFFSHKYPTPHLVTIEYRDSESRYGPMDFPAPAPVTILTPKVIRSTGTDAVERARKYAAVLPPAISGEHGDLHTFRVCCRLARGFALSDDEALDLLREWNTRCQPPWSEPELLDKLQCARRYGREPIGGLLEAPP